MKHAAFSPDGKTLAVSAEGVVFLYETVEWMLRGKLIPESGGEVAIAFSPDGKALASGGKGHRVALFDVSSMKKLAVFEGHTGAVTTVAFSPDGRLLASGSSDSTILTWDVVAAQDR